MGALLGERQRRRSGLHQHAPHPAKQKGDTLGVPEEHRQAMLDKIPMGRFGEPEDVANAVLFFASPLSDYVTGQEINVSGGLQIP